MYMHKLGGDIYTRLYPPGWCLVPAMETHHYQLCSKVTETLHLDSIGRLLIQLIVMFQVKVITYNSLEKIVNSRYVDDPMMFYFRQNLEKIKWMTLRKCKYVGSQLPSLIAESHLRGKDYLGKF